MLIRSVQRVHTNPEEYPLTFKKSGETPTTPSGGWQSQSRLLAHGYDYIIWCYGWSMPHFYVHVVHESFSRPLIHGERYTAWLGPHKSFAQENRGQYPRRLADVHGWHYSLTSIGIR